VEEVGSSSSCCCCCCLPVVPLVLPLVLLRFLEMGPRKPHTHIEVSSFLVQLVVFGAWQLSNLLLDYDTTIMVIVEHMGSVKGNVFLTSPNRGFRFDVNNNLFFKV